MKFLVKETNEVKELTAMDKGIDYIGNIMDLSYNKAFEYDEDNDWYATNAGEYNWWANYIDNMEQDKECLAEIRRDFLKNTSMKKRKKFGRKSWLGAQRVTSMTTITTQNKKR